MSVMRHWLAHDVQGTVVVKSEAVAAKYREHGTPLDGPFVPEATLRGAVAENERLRAAINRYLDATGYTPVPPWARLAADELRTALGGQ